MAWLKSHAAPAHAYAPAEARSQAADRRERSRWLHDEERRQIDEVRARLDRVEKQLELERGNRNAR